MIVNGSSIKKSSTLPKNFFEINPHYVKDSLAGTHVNFPWSEKMKGTLDFSFSGKKAYGNGFSASKLIEEKSFTDRAEIYTKPYDDN